MPLLFESDRATASRYVSAMGGAVRLVESWPGLVKELDDSPEEVLVVVGPDVPLEPALDFAEAQRLARPALGVLLLRRRLDVQLLGAALRAGVREVLLAEDMPALSDACARSVEVSRRAAGWQPTARGRPEGRIVTVFAAKGGCGKTTMSTNLAAALADGGRRSVCLVDLDLAFGDVAIALQLFPAKSAYDAVGMGDRVDEAGVRSIVTPHSPGLDTVLAPMEPGDAEKIPVTVVSDLLSVLRRMYDVVVVDTPPDFKEWVLAALDVSDTFVLLATLDIPALKNLRLTLDMLDLLGYPRESWKVVLNRSDSKVGLDVADVERTLTVSIAAQVPSSRAVSTSINRGIPLVLEQPNHPVSQAVRRFAETLVPSGPVAAGPAGPAEGAPRRGPAPSEAPGPLHLAPRERGSRLGLGLRRKAGSR